MIAVKSSRYSLSPRKPRKPSPFFRSLGVSGMMAINPYFLNKCRVRTRKLPPFLIVPSFRIRSFQPPPENRIATPLGALGATIAMRTVTPSRVSISNASSAKAETGMNKDKINIPAAHILIAPNQMLLLVACSSCGYEEGY